MNEFGPHTAEVQEVIDFALSGGVLRGPFRPEDFSDFDTRIVHSLDDVFRYRNPAVPRAESWSTGEAWWDIRQSDMREFYKQKKGILPGYREVSNRIVEASTAIQERLLELLAGVLPEERIIDISDDFEMIMLFRAVFGRNDYIDEKFFRVYQASGYSVGWIGEFPEGQLVVFSR